MSKEDRESALDKLASYLGGFSSDVVKAKKKRKKELETIAKQSGTTAKKKDQYE